MGDVWAGDSGGRTILRVSGSRRAWGSPAASVTLDVPPGMDQGVLSFWYRMPEGGQVFIVRAVTAKEQMTLWHTDEPAAEFSRRWVDVGRCAGQVISLRFELWGAKGAPPGIVEIDDVIFGHVPVLDG